MKVLFKKLREELVDLFDRKFEEKYPELSDRIVEEIGTVIEKEIGFLKWWILILFTLQTGAFLWAVFRRKQSA